MGDVLQFIRGYAFIDRPDSNTFEIRLQEEIPAQSFVILMFRIDENHEQARFQQGIQNIQEFKDWLKNGGDFKSRHYMMSLNIDTDGYRITVLNQWPTTNIFLLSQENYEDLLQRLES